MSALEVLVALVIAVGLVGVLVPMLPGSALVGAAVLVWALAVAEPAGWVVLAVVVGLLVAGGVIKYVVPGRRLQTAGIPSRTLLLGGVVGVVGFFVVPVVGLPLGFLLGVYVAEWHRLGDAVRAWSATWHAVRAVGLGVLIELTFGVLAAATWAAGVVLT